MCFGCEAFKENLREDKMVVKIKDIIIDNNY